MKFAEQSRLGLECDGSMPFDVRENKPKKEWGILSSKSAASGVCVSFVKVKKKQKQQISSDTGGQVYREHFYNAVVSGEHPFGVLVPLVEP